MKASLSNQIHLSGFTLEQSAEIQHSLTFRNPKYGEAQQKDLNHWPGQKAVPWAVNGLCVGHH